MTTPEINFSSRGKKGLLQTEELMLKKQLKKQ